MDEQSFQQFVKEFWLFYLATFEIELLKLKDPTQDSVNFASKCHLVFSQAVHHAKTSRNIVEGLDLGFSELYKFTLIIDGFHKVGDIYLKLKTDRSFQTEVHFMKASRKNSELLTQMNKYWVMLVDIAFQSKIQLRTFPEYQKVWQLFNQKFHLKNSDKSRVLLLLPKLTKSPKPMKEQFVDPLTLASITTAAQIYGPEIKHFLTYLFKGGLITESVKKELAQVEEISEIEKQGKKVKKLLAPFKKFNLYEKFFDWSSTLHGGDQIKLEAKFILKIYEQLQFKMPGNDILHNDMNKIHPSLKTTLIALKEAEADFNLNESILKKQEIDNARKNLIKLNNIARTHLIDLYHRHCEL